MPDTRRIARNTLFLYFRQILIMAVSLYTSRIVLDVLGISDYGIYSVIGGFVAMFSVVSGSMSGAVNRFIVLEIGRKNEKKIQKIFAASMLIQAVICVAVIILCEIIGCFFLYNKLNIPSDRLNAAFWVMQCSMLTFVVNLLSVPYNAIIIAHEHMNAFAYISILEAVLTLTVSFLLHVLPFDKLIVYAVLLFTVSVIIRFVYSLYCRKHFYNEASFSFSFNRNLLSEMRRYIGWTFLGNGVIVIKDYGTNILLNMFRGTAMSAARGVAGQVNSAANSFVSNFMTAMKPQISKSYAEKDFGAMHTLIIRGQKFGFFIMFMLFVMLVPNIHVILTLWLKEVPPHTANIVMLILLYSLTETYLHPLVTGVVAEGNIKDYELGLTAIYAANVAVSYVVLRAGLAVEWVFVLNIVFKLCVCILLLVCSRMKYAFPVRKFITGCVVPTICVLALCTATVFLFHTYGAENFGKLLLQSAVNCIVAVCAILFIGLNGNERQFIFRALKKRLRFRKEKRQ